MRLFAGFASLALILAAVGLYGLMSYSVSQRSQELGLRLALGADRLGITALVLKEALRLTGLGVLVGLVGAFMVSHAMKTTLYGVNPLSPAVTLAVASALMGTALLASFLPARRAGAADPMEALRNN